jgi:transposase
MARAYSLDLRERVVAMVARGETCRSVAAAFDVSVASVVKWSQRARTTGSAAAKVMGGKRPYLLEGERSFLLGRLAEKPDLTLHAVLSELRERGVAVSCDTLWRFLRREGVSFKKTLFASEQDRRDVARRRTLWKKIQLRLDPRRLVFIDETWAKTNMTRTHGWNRRGEALIAKTPQGHWKTMTFLAALRCDEITAPFVLDGPINGESFLAYVEQVLAPTLKRGDIVVMDNLGSHKRAAINKAIRAKGARRFFLPQYSPDLNPIEQVFAKLKKLLRKAEERTPEGVWRRIGTLLECFSPTECANYFRNSGYAST